MCIRVGRKGVEHGGMSAAGRAEAFRSAAEPGRGVERLSLSLSLSLHTQYLQYESLTTV